MNFCGILTDPPAPIVLGCFYNFYWEWGFVPFENIGTLCDSDLDCFRGWCLSFPGWSGGSRCSDLCVTDADCGGGGNRCNLGTLSISVPGLGRYPETMVRVCDNQAW